MDLSGKTAIVTGASKGIGLAVAEALAEAGMNVTMTARGQEGLDRAVAGLNARDGGRGLAYACDVRDLEQQRGCVAATVAAFGGVDLLVANAAVGAREKVDELDPTTWSRIVDTNLTGVFYSVAVAVAELKRSRGMIVTIGSLAGVNFFAGGAAYNASKFGLLGFTQAAMLDLRDHGVRVSTIMPGSVATTFSDRAVTEADGWKLQPSDIAQTVLYLLGMPAEALPSKVELRPARVNQAGVNQAGVNQAGAGQAKANPA